MDLLGGRGGLPPLLLAVHTLLEVVFSLSGCFRLRQEGVLFLLRMFLRLLFGVKSWAKTAMNEPERFLASRKALACVHPLL